MRRNKHYQKQKDVKIKTQKINLCNKSTKVDRINIFNTYFEQQKSKINYQQITKKNPKTKM